MHRICVYTKDVQVITGKSERQSRQIIKQIRTLKNKEKHQPVTIHDLCDYMGFDLQSIRHLVR